MPVRALAPLYPSVPEAARKDARPYTALPLLDALPGYHQLKGEFSKRGFDRELRGHLAERCGGWLARLAFDDALAERVQTVLQRLTLLAHAA